MKLTLGIAENLLLLLKGKRLPASRLRHPVVAQLLADGIIQTIQMGRTKQQYFISQPENVAPYLKNSFGIADLEKYIEVLKSADGLRADAVIVASNSKLKAVRTFKGFPINVYAPVSCKINSYDVVLYPQNGLFNFIYDYQSFKIPDDVTVVGIENPENFRHIDRQQYLFASIKPLFVSRYPQSKDVIRWLLSIPNAYLHFGDFDVEGINIYWQEYKKHLQNRASFFVPPGIETIVASYGSRALYNQQKLKADLNSINEKPVFDLYQAIQKHKKGLEQEVLIYSGL